MRDYEEYKATCCDLAKEKLLYEPRAKSWFHYAKVKLDPNPARTDLTSREVAKLLGGFLGGLLEMAEIDEIEAAVKWWADTPEAWEGFVLIKGKMSALKKDTERTWKP